jgi:hypothetical protein
MKSILGHMHFWEGECHYHFLTILSSTGSRRICFSDEQNINNIFKLLISIVNDSRKEISGNSHAEI